MRIKMTKIKNINRPSFKTYKSIYVEKEIHQKLKIKAIEKGQKLSYFVNDFITTHLSEDT